MRGNKNGSGKKVDKKKLNNSSTLFVDNVAPQLTIIVFLLFNISYRKVGKCQLLNLLFNYQLFSLFDFKFLPNIVVLLLIKLFTAPYENPVVIFQ
jgi:hypothetical protein